MGAKIFPTTCVGEMVSKPLILPWLGAMVFFADYEGASSLMGVGCISNRGVGVCTWSSGSELEPRLINVGGFFRGGVHVESVHFFFHLGPLPLLSSLSPSTCIFWAMACLLLVVLGHNFLVLLLRFFYPFSLMSPFCLCLEILELLIRCSFKVVIPFCDALLDIFFGDEE
jgi:hypothetical protein